ncbi:M50 family metallopeptidase [Streptomyces sp. NPDC059740]|uniref:M50 family metallopeptidase n=1 Tax=Streptomyces sp. NPDC059740 TaxID=3346926 RepID=UPI003654CFF6
MNTDHLTDIGDRLLGTQPHPPAWLAVVTALVALAAVAPHGVWRVSRNAVTIAHEGGHALVALLSGRRLDGIRLHSDTSGLTVSRGRAHGPGMVLTAAAGYVTPSLLGLGGAWLLAAGHTTLLLWGATVLLLAMLVMIRNAYGVLTVVVSGGAFLAVSWLTTAHVQAVFAYAVVWFLLLGGVRPPFELRRTRRRAARRSPLAHLPGGHRAARPAGGDSDADQLARLTRMPAAVWLAFFHLVTLCCLLGGGRWLLGL